ncbi:hypothetical protein F4777DRAFT_597702 [Nemania sp. FL0916]|nr:hypothetical protein F4777DRAFT_597702 [Nemania sp. FL0916]
MAHQMTTIESTRPSDTADSHKLSKSEQHQKYLRQHFITNLKFSRQETLAFELASKEDFEVFWNTAIAAKKGFDIRHDHGLSKITGKVAKFRTSAAVVWSDIAPILDILKDVGSPFSEVAIGTVAFMFTVAKTRENMESLIGATFKSIRDRLPGIETYQRIYRHEGELNERLKSTIIEAYDCFMEFCMAAITFYTTSGFSRWLKALGGSTSIDEAVSNVEQAIVNVRLVCEELLNETVANLKSINEELRRQHDGQALELIGSLMKLSPHSLETELENLKRHRANIAAEFNNWYSRRRTPKAPLASVTSNQIFQSWRTSDNSRILVLTGRNRIIQARNCWLSPVALDIIAERDSPKIQDPCVFYILGLQPVDDTFAQVASSLIFRLLSLNRHILRDEKQYAELQAELQIYDQATRIGHEPHIIQESLGRVALRTLNMFDPSMTVWIIIDRADQCRGHGSRNLHRKALLKFLVRLVENENLKVRVRVLTVVNGVDWKPEEQEDEIDRSKNDSIVFLTLEQTQAE